MRARRVALAAGFVALHVARAAADPTPPLDRPLHLRTASHVTTQGGSELDLPPGYYLTEQAWDALDFKVTTLQDDRTRLEAENASLRASAGTGAPWWALAAAVAVGAAAGAYAWDRWAD